MENYPPQTAIKFASSLKTILVSRTAHRRLRSAVIALSIGLSGLATHTASALVTMDLVTVGNPGNLNDSQTGNVYGGVPYEYRIGKFEVTVSQYAAFLNSVASSGDPHSLWVSSMGASTGGITRGDLGGGNYTYTVKENWGNKPITHVGFWDSVRFTNWLSNGQPTGAASATTTENGAYTLGGVTNPVNNTVTRNTVNPNTGSAVGLYYLPTVSEWYKAAYHNPSNGIYYTYATSSNSAPIAGSATATGDLDTSAAPFNAYANYNGAADWPSNSSNVTTVGSAGAFSVSPYGTFDQSGNAMEWTDTIYNDSYRYERGGSITGASNTGTNAIWKYASGFQVPNGDDYAHVGFRVMELVAVPEPATWGLLLGAGLMGMAALKNRRIRNFMSR